MLDLLRGGTSHLAREGRPNKTLPCISAGTGHCLLRYIIIPAHYVCVCVWKWSPVMPIEVRLETRLRKVLLVAYNLPSHKADRRLRSSHGPSVRQRTPICTTHRRSATSRIRLAPTTPICQTANIAVLIGHWPYLGCSPRHGVQPSPDGAMEADVWFGRWSVWTIAVRTKRGPHIQPQSWAGNTEKDPTRPYI